MDIKSRNIIQLLIAEICLLVFAQCAPHRQGANCPAELHYVTSMFDMCSLVNADALCPAVQEAECSSRNCGAVQIYFENENRRLTKDECCGAVSSISCMSKCDVPASEACSNHPTASCEVSSCTGKCTVSWFVRDIDVTAWCVPATATTPTPTTPAPTTTTTTTTTTTAAPIEVHNLDDNAVMSVSIDDLIQGVIN